MQEIYFNVIFNRKKLLQQFNSLLLAHTPVYRDRYYGCIDLFGIFCRFASTRNRPVVFFHCLLFPYFKNPILIVSTRTAVRKLYIFGDFQESYNMTYIVRQRLCNRISTPYKITQYYTHDLPYVYNIYLQPYRSGIRAVWRDKH